MAGTKKVVYAAMLVMLCLVVSACGSGGNGKNAGASSGGSASPSASGSTSPSQTKEAAPEQTKPGEKIKMTLMITSADNPASKEIEGVVAEHFKDKYDITFKPWDGNNAEKTIKTTIAANNPIDLTQYWPTQMETFVNADMALDLTPYLDANGGEWRNSFLDRVIESGTYNGKVYALPFSAVYPMLIANQDILDKAGVKLPDGPQSWDDFMAMLGRIQEKTGVWPIGINKDWAAWVPRNNLITIWPDDARMTAFATGKTPFTDPLVVEAFEASKELYDKYVYPGKGALTTTLDQVNIAFKQGKIAIKADVNTNAAQSIKDSGLTNISIGSWPTKGLNYVLGGSDGYFIPANAKHPEASIEIMKYLTSPEILQMRVDKGSPVTIKDVKSDDPNLALYSKDAGRIEPKEIINVAPQFMDIVNGKMPANYIFNGKSSLDELEKVRRQVAAGGQ
ncbi:ABC transporter substrate-binding protein [Cohnella zeiphila]|uniref:Extracellular solute-binding protein n=1 Tax=Cohnella zeiphila TaxID=2761120 RepID=A0A7X0SLH9_9BACL|nr:extracellular solute-binding protein [Cohnella zeiphila]MBB6732094.1 extracellular solute-binding protein [Cohnella zeiphila]